MENPFELEKSNSGNFTGMLREETSSLKVGESKPIKMNGKRFDIARAALRSNGVPGKFRTKKDRSDDDILWVQRTE